MKKTKAFLFTIGIVACIENTSVYAINTKMEHLMVNIVYKEAQQNIPFKIWTSGCNDFISSAFPIIGKATARVTEILESHGYDESDIGEK
ncbi:MAG: hypothetical protein IJ730_02235 [Alphaproteobacteria bacterium]|nr:hypothetical protein [Alphaproteobacteria bacterium]